MTLNWHLRLNSHCIYFISHRIQMCKRWIFFSFFCLLLIHTTRCNTKRKQSNEYFFWKWPNNFLHKNQNKYSTKIVRETKKFAIRPRHLAIVPFICNLRDRKKTTALQLPSNSYAIFPSLSFWLTLDDLILAQMCMCVCLCCELLARDDIGKYLHNTVWLPVKVEYDFFSFCISCVPYYYCVDCRVFFKYVFFFVSFCCIQFHIRNWRMAWPFFSNKHKHHFSKQPNRVCNEQNDKQRERHRKKSIFCSPLWNSYKYV